MTTPARERATEALLAYHRQLEEFQQAWGAEVGAWLAWTTMASERGPSDPDVVELREAWMVALRRRYLAAGPLNVAGMDLNDAVRAVEQEVLHG
ncbi:hypothetical protein JRI60_26935 [Archangium violaceum]|uniref:hypothetical protein n=1 Tax=Archangium violaceum TaxID=83451 RepID=UPI00194F99F9|nr:hypothetical protein [Archangium violaceum]QRN92848.1 hypothetical protein JRI60_26935 [Archangium violaceum]